MTAALWCEETWFDVGVDRRKLRDSAANCTASIIRSKTTRVRGRENGFEMVSKFDASLASASFVSRIGIKASDVDPVSGAVRLDGPAQRVWTGHAIVLAMGVKADVVLGIRASRSFQGRGRSRIGVRDRELVKGKRVLIVGGGDAAFENDDQSFRFGLVGRRLAFRRKRTFGSKRIRSAPRKTSQHRASF
jgi:hypothetical protein